MDKFTQRICEGQTMWKRGRGSRWDEVHACAFPSLYQITPAEDLSKSTYPFGTGCPATNTSLTSHASVVSDQSGPLVCIHVHTGPQVRCGMSCVVCRVWSDQAGWWHMKQGKAGRGGLGREVRGGCALVNPPSARAWASIPLQGPGVRWTRRSPQPDARLSHDDGSLHAPHQETQAFLGLTHS